MARVLSHPTRFQILIDMNTPLRRLSPSEFSNKKGEPLSNISYHFRILHKAGCIEEVGVIQRRGATEHVYEPVKRAMAWAREWALLGSYVRENIAGSALGGAVKLLGRSIDEGTFDKREDSHLSYDCEWVDEQGWEEVQERFLDHLKDLLIITEQIKQRLDADPAIPRFLATYFMASFETPPEGDDSDHEE
jgi:hypothetical protein